jgi:hypothetical protein
MGFENKVQLNIAGFVKKPIASIHEMIYFIQEVLLGFVQEARSNSSTFVTRVN